MKTHITQNLKAIILGLILTLCVGYVAAATDGTYTDPTCPPPSCNASAPINVGGASQTKVGNLGMGSISQAILDAYKLAVGGDFYVAGNSVFNGNVVIPANAGVNRVLMSDINGRASWADLSGVSGTDAAIYTFTSSYYKLMQDNTVGGFREWFSTFTNGTNLLKPLAPAAGSAYYNSEGWAENSKTETRSTANKLCNFFTNGPAVSYTIASLGSDNHNTFYTWDDVSSSWKMSVSSWINSVDIPTVSCLALHGVVRGASFKLPNTPIGDACAQQKYNSTVSPGFGKCSN